MKKESRGQCLIINNEDFKGKQSSRIGSKNDEILLQKLFTLLKFNVRDVERDLDKASILERLKTLGIERDDDAFVLCILTHGKSNDLIVGADGQKIKARYILFSSFAKENTRIMFKMHILLCWKRLVTFFQYWSLFLLESQKF